MTNELNVDHYRNEIALVGGGAVVTQDLPLLEDGKAVCAATDIWYYLARGRIQRTG